VSVEPQRRIDGADAGNLVLSACPVDTKHVLATGDKVLEWINASLDTARIAQAAQLLGVARQAFDTTLEYLNVRVQFGKPIGSFQSLQHRMVDAYIQIQLLDYAIVQALGLVEHDEASL